MTEPLRLTEEVSKEFGFQKPTRLSPSPMKWSRKRLKNTG